MVTTNDAHETNFSEEEPTIDLLRYWSLFRQWWWLVALATVLAGTAAYLYSLRLPRVYESATTLMINEAPSYGAADYNTLITNERLAQTYAQIMTTRPVMEKVVERLGLHQVTPDYLAELFTVTPVTDTQLLVVTVRSDDPNFSADIANAVVLVFSEQIQDMQSSRFAASQENLKKQMVDTEKQVLQIREEIAMVTDNSEKTHLETRLNQYEQIYANLVVSFEQVRMLEAQSSANLVQVERAVANPLPVSPKKMQNTLLAAVVGMMLSLGGIFAYDTMDDTVKSPDDIQRALKLTVMGSINHFEEPEDGRLITQTSPRSPVAESFRALRTNVQYASVDKPVHTLLITSPAPSDGKTTIVANLGVVIAQSARRVTIIDADLHRPRVHRVFNMDNSLGLSNLFVKPRVHLNGEFQQTHLGLLHVVSAGKLPPNPSELLGSNKMREIMNVTLKDEDLVIIDSPPILSVTDAVVLAPTVDAVLLVVRPGRTRMSALKHAVEQLRYVGANLVGVVLNDIDGKSSRYGYYYKSQYYSQYKYYGTGGKTKDSKLKTTS